MKKIKQQTDKLTAEELFDLVEDLIHQLKMKKFSGKSTVNWQDLYGIGKGIWKEDAQDYIDRVRSER